MTNTVDQADARCAGKTRGHAEVDTYGLDIATVDSSTSISEIEKKQY